MIPNFIWEQFYKWWWLKFFVDVHCAIDQSTDEIFWLTDWHAKALLVFNWYQYTLLLVVEEICMLVMFELRVLVETFEYIVTAVSCLCYFGWNLCCVQKKETECDEKWSGRSPIKKGGIATILKCYLSFSLYDIVPLDLPPVTSEAKPSVPPSSRRDHDDDTSGADGLSQLPFHESQTYTFRMF